MAISRNLYTRGLAQRLAGAVWYQRHGQTLVRELAPQVTNPQTDAQMQQRVKLANVVAVYRANKDWMSRYAFEGRPNTQTVYNAFVSANLTSNPVYLTKQDVSEGAAVAAPYQFTRGSLPSIGMTWDVGNDIFYTDLYVGDLSMPAGDTTTTVAQLTAALIANNNGIQEGDQLSCVQNLQRTDAQGVPFITVRTGEIILSLSDDTPVAQRAGGAYLLTQEYGSSRLCVVSAGTICGALMCLSRSSGGQILVSSQTMVMTTNSYYSNYTGSAGQRRSIRSYAGDAQEPFLTPTYQGGTQSIPTDLSILTLNGETAGGTTLAGEGVNTVTLVLSSPIQYTDIREILITVKPSDADPIGYISTSYTVSADGTAVNAIINVQTAGSITRGQLVTVDGQYITIDLRVPGDVTE